MAGLQAEEGDARARLDRDAAHFAGRAVEAGGDVDREDRPAGSRESVDAPMIAAASPSMSRASPRRTARRSRNPRPPRSTRPPAGPGPRSARRRAPGRRAAPRAAEQAELDRGSPAREQPRRDEAVAAVAARPAQDDDPPARPGTAAPPRRATARPARSMSTMPGVPPAIGEAVGHRHLGGGQEFGAARDRAWAGEGARPSPRKREKLFPSPRFCYMPARADPR